MGWLVDLFACRKAEELSSTTGLSRKRGVLAANRWLQAGGAHFSRTRRGQHAASSKQQASQFFDLSNKRDQHSSRVARYRLIVFFCYFLGDRRRSVPRNGPKFALSEKKDRKGSSLAPVLKSACRACGHFLCRFLQESENTHLRRE